MIVSKCAICGGKVEERNVNIERSIMDRKRLKKLDVVGSTYRLGYDATV